MNTLEQTLAFCQNEHTHRSRDWQGWCLLFTRSALGITYKYGTALDAWNGSQKKVSGAPPETAIGAPCFWDTHQGHAAIYAGNGNVWTTDLPVTGNVGLYPLANIGPRWGKKFLGWSRELNGVAIPWLNSEEQLGGEEYEVISPEDWVKLEQVSAANASRALQAWFGNSPNKQFTQQQVDEFAKMLHAGGTMPFACRFKTPDRNEQYIVTPHGRAWISPEDIKEMNLTSWPLVIKPASHWVFAIPLLNPPAK